MHTVKVFSVLHVINTVDVGVSGLFLFTPSVVFNWKCDWHGSVFLKSRRCRFLNAQIRVWSGACSRTVETDSERETEVSWRDETSSDMTRWSGSKHGRYSTEPAQEHRSLPPSSSPCLVPPLLIVHHLSLSPSVSFSLIISVTAPRLPLSARRQLRLN